MTVDRDPAFSAIADPTRRRLIEWLQESGPATATQLSTRLPISRQGVSKHLRELELAGFATSVKAGRETRYAYSDDGLAHISDWIDARERAWNRTLSRLKDHAESS